ncbi:MAG TPA: hypothetical protein VHA33_03195 [Candidatus Angelobacter sp.]|jgi:hypothetical protein|nr:hypothetical protein [Candidatus Angelobacter sp.]
MKAATRLVGLIVCGVILLSISIFAQTNVNEEQGLKPYDSLHGGELDAISLTSGGLVLDLPLATFPQRGGLDLSFMVRYSGKQWQVKTTCAGRPPHQICSSSWVPARGMSGAQVLSSLDWWKQTTTTIDPSFFQTVSSPDGNAHQVGGSSTQADPLYPSHSLDASGLFMLDANTLVMPNGIRYSYLNGLGNNLYAGFQPSSVTDANGNQITISSSGWTVDEQ